MLATVEFTNGNLYRASALSGLAWQMCKNLELPNHTCNFIKLQAQSHREILKYSLPGAFTLDSSFDIGYEDDLSKLCKLSQEVYWELKTNLIIDCAALLRKCDQIENIINTLTIECIIDESHEHLIGLWYHIGSLFCSLSRAAIFARSGVVNLAKKWLNKAIKQAYEEIRIYSMMCFLMDLLTMVIIYYLVISKLDIDLPRYRNRITN